MEHTFPIGQIANYFDIAPSTLRYWEEVGVVTPQKNSKNGYREYSVSDLMIISDVLFYQSLGIPLKQIRNMHRMELSSHEGICAQQMKTLHQQRSALKRRIRKLQYHMAALDTIRHLQEHPYQITAIDLECIVPFELVEIEKLKQYIENPRLYSRVQHSDHLDEEHRGLSITQAQKDREGYTHTLWENRGGRYVTFLMREEIAPGFPSMISFQERHTWKFALPLSTDSLLTLVPFHAIFIVPIAVKKEESAQFLLLFAQNLCFFGKEGKLCCESPSATMKKDIWKK